MYERLLNKIFPKYRILSQSFPQIQEYGQKIIGKYYFEPLWFKDKYLSFIYQDSTSLRKGVVGKAKNNYLLYYNNCSCSGISSFYINDYDNQREFEYCDGLDGLIDNNYDIVDASEKEEEYYECCRCGDRRNNVDYRDNYDDYYCDYCFSEIDVICNGCRCHVHVDNAHFFDSEAYCSECFSDCFTICRNCNNYENNENMISVKPSALNNLTEICQNCASSDDFCECYECNNTFSIVDLEEHKNGELYCKDCLNKIKEEE
jgi:hypothetical protein